MFEKFTDRARKSFQLARQAAQQLGHEWLAPEHIFLGILREGSGVACNIMLNLGVNRDFLRDMILNLLGNNDDDAPVTISKLLRTPLTKQTVEFAIEESRNAGHKHVGTEHLLLGLLRLPESSVSMAVWREGANVPIEVVRESIARIYGSESVDPLPELEDLTAIASTVIEYLKSHKPGTFEPGSVFCHDRPWVEVYWKDDPCYAETISDDLVVMRSNETKEVVGVKIYGVRKT